MHLGQTPTRPWSHGAAGPCRTGRSQWAPRSPHSSLGPLARWGFRSHQAAMCPPRCSVPQRVESRVLPGLGCPVSAPSAGSICPPPTPVLEGCPAHKERRYTPVLGALCNRRSRGRSWELDPGRLVWVQGYTLPGTLFCCLSTRAGGEKLGTSPSTLRPRSVASVPPWVWQDGMGHTPPCLGDSGPGACGNEVSAKESHGGSGQATAGSSRVSRSSPGSRSLRSPQEWPVSPGSLPSPCAWGSQPLLSRALGRGTGPQHLDLPRGLPHCHSPLGTL